MAYEHFNNIGPVHISIISRNTNDKDIEAFLRNYNIPFKKTERWLSGLKRIPAKDVYRNITWVRIPSFPNNYTFIYKK